jgi:hypothetical protein
MRPACNARIPARATGPGCMINSFNAGVIFCCAAVANPVSDMPGQSAANGSRIRCQAETAPSKIRATSSGRSNDEKWPVRGRVIR